MRFVIDKSAVNKNAAKIVDLADKSQVIGVVKANGYGLGTVEFAKILIQNGIDFLAVSSLGQAEALRKADINEDILLLTPVATVQDAEEAVMLNLTATIDSVYSAELLNSVAIKNSGKVKAHIKIDTGFGRYGFLPGEETKIKEVILKSKNNRLVWGSMIALDTITLINPKEVYDLLPIIISTIDNGSVISIDHGVGIIAQLTSIEAYAETTFPLLIEQLKKCPAKQLPMYAEKSMIAINLANQNQFVDLIESRISEMDRDSQKQRLNKVISKLRKK